KVVVCCSVTGREPDVCTEPRPGLMDTLVASVVDHDNVVEAPRFTARGFAEKFTMRGAANEATRIAGLKVSLMIRCPCGSTRVAWGKESGAEDESPWTFPGPTGRPRIVDVTPPEVIFLMRSLLVSATYKLPFGSTATAYGRLNAAAVPVPSVKSDEPLPANV